MSSPIQFFVRALEEYKANLEGSGYWHGAIKPTNVLVDGTSPTMPRTPLLQTPKGRVASSVMRGIMMYTTSLKLYDLVVCQEGENCWQKDIWIQPPQNALVGDNIVRFIESLSTINKTLSFLVFSFIISPILSRLFNSSTVVLSQFAAEQAW